MARATSVNFVRRTMDVRKSTKLILVGWMDGWPERWMDDMLGWMINDSIIGCGRREARRIRLNVVASFHQIPL